MKKNHSNQKAFIQFRVGNQNNQVVDVIRKYFKKTENVYDCREKLFNDFNRRYGTEEYDVIEIWEHGFNF